MGRDVDHLAACRAQLRKQVADQEKRREEIDLELGPNLLVRQRLQRTRLSVSGVVDQTMQPARFLPDALAQPSTTVVVCYIQPEYFEAPVVGRKDIACRARRPQHAPIRCCQEAPNHQLSEAGGATGDDREFWAGRRFHDFIETLLKAGSRRVRLVGEVNRSRWVMPARTVNEYLGTAEETQERD
jgi:hypothetical protein